MIYNLVEYLKNQLTSITFIANGWTQDSAIESILITQTGGEPNHSFDRTDWNVQIMSRAKSSVKAKENIDYVYDLLKNRFGLELSAVTVNSKVYPSIKTYQILPMQAPNYLGADEQGLEMWVFNIVVTTK